MFKYPYVADKKLYAAMMFACKMIRENGYFNKAISKAADWYKVDESKLAQIVRERQGAGQKAKSKPKKYKWYTCVIEQLTDSGLFVIGAVVKKGLSQKNVEKIVNSYYGDSSYFFEDSIKVIKEYETKNEAKEKLDVDFQEYCLKVRYDDQKMLLTGEYQS